MILGFHLAHQGDDVLLHLCRLTLRGLLLGVLFGKVPTDHAAADRANYGVVPRVMPSDPAYHRALEAACGVWRACRCEGQRGCNQGDFYRARFHSKVLRSSQC